MGYDWIPGPWDPPKIPKPKLPDSVRNSFGDLMDLLGGTAPGAGLNNLINFGDVISNALGGGEDRPSYGKLSKGRGGNNVSGILEGALAGAGMGAAKGGPRRGGLSADQQLLAQLDALINGSMSGFDDSALREALSEANSATRQQYAAPIGLLRDQAQGARKDTRVGSKRINEMYAALGRDYRKGARQEFKAGKKVSNQLQKLGKGQQAAVAKSTGDINEKIGEIAAGLGAPEILAESAAKTNEQGQMLGANALKEASQDAKMAMGMSGVEGSYLRGQGSNVRLEGTNRAADLYAQLSDYLAQNRSQIAELVAQRQAAIANNKASISGQFQDQQADAMQNLIDNKMNLAQLRMQLQNAAMDRQAKMADIYGSSSSGGDNPFDLFAKQSGGPSMLLGAMGDPTVNNIYREFSDNNSMRLGYYDDNGDANRRVPLQDNYAGMMDYVQERMGPAWNKLSPAQRQVLLNALLLQLQGAHFNIPSS